MLYFAFFYESISGNKKTKEEKEIFRSAGKK
jgi:hypothetical protein